MQFTVSDNILLNDGEAIANFVPRIRGLYSANTLRSLSGCSSR